MLLNLIEEKERFARLKHEGVVYSGNCGDDGLRLVAICGDGLEYRAVNEVDFNHMFIVFRSKVANSLGLANLPCALDYERFSRRLRLPVLKESVNFSFKVHTSSMIWRVLYHNFQVRCNTFCSESCGMIHTFRSESCGLSCTFHSEFETASQTFQCGKI